MSDKLQHSWRSPVIFMLIIAMMGGLFFSRALLSLSMMAFVIVAFLHSDLKKHILHFFSSPLLWGMSLLFILPLLSGLWSEDQKQWADIMRIKLPLLFLPLAFAGPIPFSQKQWDWICYVFIGLVFLGACWSLSGYLADADKINESYLRAKAIITPLENDRVRFSWLVSIAALLAGWVAVKKRQEHILLPIGFWVVTIFLVVFLHILAVRTGLFSFYISLLGFIIWLLTKKNRIGYGLALLIVLIALPWVAYKTIPSFQNRVSYFIYDSGFFKKAEYVPGMNDVMRVISIKGGWQVMNENPVTGVGFGDILPATREWYGLYYKNMEEADKILPGSEWMIYGAGCGWPGLLVFAVAMAIPFFIKTADPLLWRILNVTAAFSFLFDIGLEVQFGVFVYVFIVLWWYKWMKADLCNT